MERRLFSIQECRCMLYTRNVILISDRKNKQLKKTNTDLPTVIYHPNDQSQETCETNVKKHINTDHVISIFLMQKNSFSLHLKLST